MDDVVISGLHSLSKGHLNKVLFQIIKKIDKEHLIYQVCSKYNRECYKYSPKMRDEFKEKFYETMLEIIIR